MAPFRDVYASPAFRYLLALMCLHSDGLHLRLRLLFHFFASDGEICILPSSAILLQIHCYSAQAIICMRLRAIRLQEIED